MVQPFRIYGSGDKALHVDPHQDHLYVTIIDYEDIDPKTEKGRVVVYELNRGEFAQLLLYLQDVYRR